MTTRTTNWLKLVFFVFVLLVLGYALGGCAHVPPPPTEDASPICDALIGPIRYSSTNKASRRYAAPDLAPELKERNQVGVQLHCPQY